ncbi:MAG: hypothetical protein AAGF76_12705 [Pseudomonadota bacterium]
MIVVTTGAPKRSTNARCTAALAFAPAAATDLIGKLRAQGFTVYDPDMSAITMMGGGLHCMHQSLRSDAAEG